MDFLDRFRHAEANAAAADMSPADGDQLIVQQLRLLGADLSKPREVLHFLYLPTEEDAESAASELRTDGYTVEVQLAADADTSPPNPWLALARKETVVDEATVTLMRPRFEALATERSGEYDGWEAAAV
jgi:Regulator of ribonuclease activity B